MPQRNIIRYFGLMCGLLLSSITAHAKIFNIDIRESSHELRPGLFTTVWAYNGTVPGPSLVVSPGERIVVKVTNNLKVPTNIHWHGLEVPNNQDGPAVTIHPGTSFTYEFTVMEPGTYWYHSHMPPVLDQLDMGLYGAFIVKDPIDEKYSGDHTFILDDWFLGAKGERLPGTGRGMMERIGNVMTINGKTGNAIEPLLFKQGELHKLRFINASTAAVHKLRITGHSFRVTHTDGHPLVESYSTDTITLHPGERLDVEVAAISTAGTSWGILSEDANLRIQIPIHYASGKVDTVSFPYIPPKSRAFPNIGDAKPNHILSLSSGMGMHNPSSGIMGHGMMGGMMGGSMGMVWMINGKAFPYTDPIRIKVGDVVKIRIQNNDIGMMHPMDHPIHIHGTYFQVLSINGKEPERETWKDTINIPAGKYVDIAFVMKNPGDWMLHCHIIDHEDNGMMTIIKAQ